MNIINYKTAIFTTGIMFMSLFFLYSQDAELKEIIISTRVGNVIDQEERERFELFQGVDSFQSAQAYRMSDGGIQIQIKFIDPATGNEEIKKQNLSNFEIIRMQEIIDHYEEIQKGEYVYKYQLSGSETVPNYEIQDSLVVVELKDGSNLKGLIVRQDVDKIYFKTIGGMETTVPKSMIGSIKPLSGKVVGGTYQRYDPNYSRLLFAPTARPLKQGDGYFSDYYVFFPGISYGITNNITLMGGFSFLPGAPLDEQLLYVAPKISINVNDKIAIAAGALLANVNEVAAGIGFMVATYGERDRSLTLGLGLGYIKESGEDFEF